jgi:monoamine oxidase
LKCNPVDDTLNQIPDADKAALIHVRDNMERLCHTIDILRPDMSLPAYGQSSVSELARSLGATETVQRIVNLWTNAMLGMAATEVSAVYFLLYCRSGGGLLQMRSDGQGGGQHLRLRTGTQSLCKGLRDCLIPGTLIYSAPVDKIEQSIGHGCIVRTRDGGQYRCSSVISTIPSPLLEHVKFSPPLSLDKQRLIANSRLGFYAKLFLVYPKSWWRDNGLCGLAQGFDGPVSLTRDASSDKDGLYALVCFIVGESGRVWSQQSPDQRVAEAIAHVDRIYGQVCPRPLYTQEQIWNNEEYSGGAPCPVVPADCLQNLAHDQWQSEGRVHFAGTETSTTWRGYMEGALASGIYAANKVIQQLATSEASVRAKL